MSMLSPQSFTEGQPSQLSLFGLDMTQTAVESIYYQDIRPISQITESSPIEFRITGQDGLEYLDLKKTYLYVKLKVVKTSDGNGIAADEETGPVNNFMNSLFSQVDVEIQGKPIASTSSHYQYKNYIQTLLKYGSDAKKSQLLAQGFYPDLPEAIGTADAKTGGNRGLFERRKLILGGKVVDFAGPINHDVFNIDRYLLNQVNLDVKFYRTNAAFALMSGETSPDYTIKLEDVVIKACKVKLNPAVIYGHDKILETVTAKYPYTRSEVKIISLAKGQMIIELDNLHQGMRPNRVVIGFTGSEGVSGSYTKNPYNFGHYHIRSISLTVDGFPVGGDALRVNFDASTGQTALPVYLSLLRTAGIWMDDASNDLSRLDFASGKCLFAFDLEPAFEGQSYLTLLKKGNVRLTAQLSTALAETTSAIIYCEYPGLFQIDKARNVIV